MNIFDLLVCVVLALAVWNGWRQGCVVQLCSLAGLIVAVWCAAKFGPEAGRFFGFDESFAVPAGFAIVLLAALCVAALIGRSIRKLLHFAGLGFADVLLGIGVAIVKYLFLVGVLFTAFDRLNADFRFVEPQTLERSKTYRPILHLAEWVFPFVEQVHDEASERISGFRDAEPVESADSQSDAETI
ncbi:MAG: CvpA family protein [Alistipes sp.]|nr:CvpA family protein [Alistipes sp.]